MARILATIALAAAVFVRNGTDIRITGGQFDHVVARGETLPSLAARYGVEMRALAEINHLDDRHRIVVGETLHIDNRHLAAIISGRVLSINIAQRMLYLVEYGEVAAAYPIAVGRSSWPTPTGSFTVVAKEIDPTWDVPDSIRAEMREKGQPVLEHVPPSPDNPLGARWIGLSIPAVGIHGTNVPSSVYRFVSHGCIRLHPDDIAALFVRVQVGDPGELVYEPVVIARVGDRILLEAHTDVYRRAEDARQRIRAEAVANGFAEQVDWQKAEDVLRRRLGLVTDVTRD